MLWNGGAVSVVCAEHGSEGAAEGPRAAHSRDEQRIAWRGAGLLQPTEREGHGFGPARAC